MGKCSSVEEEDEFDDAIARAAREAERQKGENNNNHKQQHAKKRSISIQGPAKAAAKHHTAAAASDQTTNRHQRAISVPLIPNPRIMDYLKKVPLLQRLSEEELGQLSGALTEQTFQASQVIIQEGDPGLDFFIVKEGEAIVSRLEGPSNAPVERSQELCRLHAGDYFGEMALLNDSKRGATVVVDKRRPVTCFVLSRKRFNQLFSKDRLNVAFAKRAGISAEAMSKKGKGHSHAPANAMRTKTPEQKEAILKCIRKNILFKNLDAAQQAEIMLEMWLVDYPDRAYVIRQGELGDNFYVAESGEYDIFVQEPGKDAAKVKTVRPGESFGELALMYNAPRAATVIAAHQTEKNALWVVDRWTFRRILTSVSSRKLREYEQFLMNVGTFAVLAKYERAKLAEALEEVAFAEGECITEQGSDSNSNFFIVKSGVVSVSIAEDDGKGVSHEVARYQQGGYFGERALLKKCPRAATCKVVSAGGAICLALDRDSFSLLLGPLSDIFHARVDSYDTIEELIARKKKGQSVETLKSHMHVPQDEPELTDKQRYRRDTHLSSRVWSMDDFKIIGTLGKGSFGHVHLVEDKKNGRTYALKAVNKQQVVNLGQQEHIMSEKRVMAVLDHMCLVRLYGTFKDSNTLYFILEPSLGGELFSVLRAKTFFDEHTARFYAASVLLAFEYIHKKGVVYRDLKPENLLIDKDGYLKITDFGFAKFVSDRTFTLCGTPDYLAPEVVSGQGHGKGVDWWTLGILIYEMLASYPPFYDEDPMKTYAKIMHGQVAFPVHFSKPAVDLIRKLLHSKPTKRYGVVKGGAQLIKDHAWFKGFDWGMFERRELKAPILLAIKDKYDLQHFEKYPEETEAPPKYEGDPKNPNWDSDF